MTYEESFLSCCNEEGQAPTWAIEQIFEEHGADLAEFIEIATEQEMDNGQVILSYLGY